MNHEALLALLSNLYAQAQEADTKMRLFQRQCGEMQEELDRLRADAEDEKFPEEPPTPLKQAAAKKGARQRPEKNQV